MPDDVLGPDGVGGVGANFDVVYGVDIASGATMTLHPTAVSPLDRRLRLTPRAVEAGPTGFQLIVDRHRPLGLPDAGDYHLEVRFDGDTTPSRVARFFYMGSDGVSFNAPAKPIVRFALFCESATENVDGTHDVSKLVGTVARVPKNAGVPLTLVFALDGEAETSTSVELRLVSPSGKKIGDIAVPIELATHFHQQRVELRGVPIHEIGDYSMEFRFSGEHNPNHVAVLRAVGPELGFSLRVN